MRTILLACVSVTALYSQIPSSMTECEAGLCNSGGAGPATWTFSGKEGSAVWPALSVRSNLRIERFDSGGVKITRQDMSQGSAGLTAVYTGKISENRVEGDVAYSWPGHADFPGSVKWYAIFNSGTPYSGKRDVNGVWHALMTGADTGIVWRMRFEQNADKVKVFWAENHNPADGHLGFEGRFVCDTAIEGTIYWPDSTPQKPHTSFGRYSTDRDNLLSNTGGIIERGPGPASVQRKTKQITPEMMIRTLQMAGRMVGIRSGIPYRIQQASGQLSSDQELCQHPGSGRTPGESHCSAAIGDRSDVNELWRELDEEIEILKRAEAKLKPSCDAGQQDACRKLQGVRIDLESDVSFKAESGR